MVLGMLAIRADEVIAQDLNYVGSEACVGCHEAEGAAWEGSHHALAWTEPTESSVLGDFDDAEYSHQGVSHRFTRRGSEFFIETDGPDGQAAEYRVMGVAGIEPLQQYLLETEPGRLQAYDVAWDILAQRWYHLYPDTGLKPGNGLHWTGPYKTWNARCAECHATGYVKAFDPSLGGYSSQQAEVGVGCEACHGPGSAHLSWARNEPFPADRELSPFGLTVMFRTINPEAEIQQCAGCHSRREPFDSSSPVPGTPFHDSYRLALLRPGLYHANGAIQDEVYVYGSFLQSKMYANGVRCSDCHDVHSGHRVADGNAICAQCHSSGGNPRFPSLRSARYDDPEHHFHTPGTPGASCTSCHMAERIYMGVDGRRDHGFRVPRPDLAAQTAAPTPCTDCHTDRDAGWAASEVAHRFPDSRYRGPHFSQVFSFARSDPAKQLIPLMEIAEDTEIPAIIRATALEMARGALTEQTASRGAALLADPDPLVREAAVGLQRSAPAVDRIARLMPMLEDRVRSVRISAARALIGAPIAHLPKRTGEALEQASAEWRASLLAKSDFPEIHLVIGGSALVMRNLPAAEAAFGEAVRMDPQLEQAWVMIARIREAQGDRAGAKAALRDGMNANPASLDLLMLDQALGD